MQFHKVEKKLAFANEESQIGMFQPILCMKKQLALVSYMHAHPYFFWHFLDFFCILFFHIMLLFGNPALLEPAVFGSKFLSPYLLSRFPMVFLRPQDPKKNATTFSKPALRIKKDNGPVAPNPYLIQRQLLRSWPLWKLRQKLSYLKANSETWLEEL